MYLEKWKKYEREVKIRTVDRISFFCSFAFDQKPSWFIVLRL